MKRTFSKMLLTLGLLTMAPTLSSCSFIFGSDGYLIQDVQSGTDAEGNTILTITYTDSSVAPLVVTLPAGMSGKDGVGIADVETAMEGDSVVLTITYTDESVEPTVLSFPVLQGEEGRGIASVDVRQDEETGNTILTFTYTDGTTSEITIPKATDGKDGVGIDTISYVVDEATGNYQITITYTDGREPTFISIPPSEDGAGIETIFLSDAQSDDDYYGLIISYSDGRTDILRLPRPQSTHWYYGDVAPSSSIGNEGDYYLNTTTGEVYCRGASGWGNPIFTMKGTGGTTTTEYCTIYFNANGGTFADGSNFRYLDSLEVGTNIPLTGENSFETVGIPTREGSTFSGWYTSPEENAFSGKFTDLTPVYGSQLTLYAHWEVEA